MKKSFALLLALIFAGCAGTPSKTRGLVQGRSSTPQKAVTLNGRDRGTFVALKANGTVTVAFESNRSAGYEWKLAQPLNTSVLSLVSPTGDRLSPIALPPDGLTSTQPEQWVFKAVGPGTAKVRMVYARPDRPLNEAVAYDFTVVAE